MARYATSPGEVRGLAAAAVAAALLACVGGTLACGGAGTYGDSPGLAKTEEFVPGEIIVWFEDGASQADVEAAVAATGGEIVRRSAVTPTRVTIAVPEGEEDAYVAAYRKLANVQLAERNVVVEAFGSTAPGSGGGEMKTKIGGD